mmetsp:Transcript_29738/g.69152  ORF Transcript_29738/g.69152 Transcript_29738/m.69152 type:complete len:290 (-) Transcript_29738:280-1149(-)
MLVCCIPGCNCALDEAVDESSTELQVSCVCDGIALHLHLDGGVHLLVSHGGTDQVLAHIRRLLVTVLLQDDSDFAGLANLHCLKQQGLGVHRCRPRGHCWHTLARAHSLAVPTLWPEADMDELVWRAGCLCGRLLRWLHGAADDSEAGDPRKCAEQDERALLCPGSIGHTICEGCAAGLHDVTACLLQRIVDKRRGARGAADRPTPLGSSVALGDCCLPRLCLHHREPQGCLHLGHPAHCADAHGDVRHRNDPELSSHLCSQRNRAHLDADHWQTQQCGDHGGVPGVLW